MKRKSFRIFSIDLVLLTQLAKSKEMDSENLANMAEIDEQEVVMRLTRLERLGYVESSVKPSVIREGMTRIYRPTSKALQELLESG